jgi:hypothetical protein
MAGIAATFISFTVFVLTHWGVCHCLKWRPLARVLNGLWLLNLVLYAALFYGLANEVWTRAGLVNFLNGLLLQVFLLIGYTAFFFLIERGLSLRILIEISRAPGGRLTLEEIKTRYSYDYILEKRVGQMLQMGYWELKDGYYYSTAKGRRFAKVHQFVWSLLRIGDA